MGFEVLERGIMVHSPGDSRLSEGMESKICWV